MLAKAMLSLSARAGAAALALAAACTAQAADTVTFAWPGAMSSGYAPFTFAQELGYFHQEKIELDTVQLQGAGVILPQIANGSVFTALVTLSPLILARQPGGANFDLKYTYNAVRGNIWELAVLESSSIRSVQDLRGKRLGVGGLAFGNVPLTKALLKSQGVDPALVEFIPVGLGVPAFDALNRGKVDALNLYDVMNVLLEQRGTRLRRLPLPAGFQQVSSYGFPVTSKVLRERPEVVARFGRAFTKGLVACKSNLKGCLASYWKRRPDQRPAEVDAAAVDREVAVLAARLRNMISSEQQVLGGFSEADWTTTIASLAEGHQVANAALKLDGLYTNQFVEQYNNFDRAAVVAQAKAYPAPK